MGRRKKWSMPRPVAGLCTNRLGIAKLHELPKFPIRKPERLPFVGTPRQSPKHPAVARRSVKLFHHSPPPIVRQRSMIASRILGVTNSRTTSDIPSFGVNVEIRWPLRVMRRMRCSM